MDSIDNIFDHPGLLERDDTMDAIYRASRVRDEREVMRLLDEHRKAHGEPEQSPMPTRASIARTITPWGTSRIAPSVDNPAKPLPRG